MASSRKQSPASQRSYDYENADYSEIVERRGTPKASSTSQSISSDSDSHISEVYEDLYLLQEIAFDLPEIESSLLSALASVKQRNSFALPVWFLMCSWHYAISYWSVFSCLVLGIFMSSPTGYSGNSSKVHVEGTLNISHYIHNPTPFAASLSSLVSVSYLPRSKTVTDLSSSKCLSYDRNTSYNTRNGGSDMLVTQLDNLFQERDNVSAPLTQPSSGAPVDKRGIDVSAVDEGNLITIGNVNHHRGSNDSELMRVVDSSMFDIFTSHLLLANKLHVVADIDKSLNEVSYLITIKKALYKTGIDGQMADQLIHDCGKGHVLLRLEVTEQRFETMFFGGDMLPRKFFPLRLPCMTTYNDAHKNGLMKTLSTQWEQFVNQYNIMLNMDTMSSRRCPLNPPERK
ncbi:hypothetical protein X943_003876 [Babesia divergens]|uniref:Uncharacterized protein n=1 Tax=Babesia divergens TaxID=32595 RepID=A0AAD9LIA5_BABDI|nr:hypothetical protein X943_003876 [Babesia divergens]